MNVLVADQLHIAIFIIMHLDLEHPRKLSRPLRDFKLPFGPRATVPAQTEDKTSWTSSNSLRDKTEAVTRRTNSTLPEVFGLKLMSFNTDNDCLVAIDGFCINLRKGGGCERTQTQKALKISGEMFKGPKIENG